MVRDAVPGDVEALAALAGETFPLACPPELPQADIAAFISDHLNPERFREYLAAPDHVVLVTDDLDGYVLMMLGDDYAPEPEYGVRGRPAACLSKCYVRDGRHGDGVAAALIAEAKRRARNLGAASIWLSTNQGNARACRFYVKQGFAQVGTKTMRVGTQLCDDFVFEASLS